MNKYGDGLHTYHQTTVTLKFSSYVCNNVNNNRKSSTMPRMVYVYYYPSTVTAFGHLHNHETLFSKVCSVMVCKRHHTS